MMESLMYYLGWLWGSKITIGMIIVGIVLAVIWINWSKKQK